MSRQFASLENLRNFVHKAKNSNLHVLVTLFTVCVTPARIHFNYWNSFDKLRNQKHILQKLPIAKVVTQM